MARQTSLYTFRNKLGNVRGIHFNNLPGEYVGLLGGPTAEQIANDPNFARTRENMSEFGGSSRANRFFRVGIAALQDMMESYYSGYLNTITIRVCRLGPGARGQREILFTSNQLYYENTNLNRQLPFNTIFNGSYTMNSNIARNQATLFIPSFTPAINLNPPAGATHFQHICGAVAMSDWEFIVGTGYQPKNPTANGASAVTFGSILALNIVAGNQTIIAPLSGSPTMTNSTMFTVIGVQFYQQVSAIFYPLFQDNTAQISLLF